MPFAVRLVCPVTGCEDHPSHATVEISSKLAGVLLTLRDVWSDLNKKYLKKAGNLVYLEFFVSDIRWGRFGDFYSDDTVWQLVPDELPKDIGFEFQCDFNIDLVTRKITDTGVLWEASFRHAGGYFETPEVVWSDLELIKRGHSPNMTIAAITCHKCHKTHFSSVILYTDDGYKVCPNCDRVMEK